MTPRKPISFNNNEIINFPQVMELLKQKEHFGDFEFADRQELGSLMAALQDKSKDISINDIFSDGPFQGASIAAFLASTNIGLQFIKAEKLADKISAEGFNAIVKAPSEKDKEEKGVDVHTGESALLGFCRHRAGREMLESVEYLLRLITPEGLNTMSAAGDSPLLLLTSTYESISRLSSNFIFIAKITSAGLEATNAQNKSVLWNLFYNLSAAGLDLLRSNPSLIEKISEKGLSANLKFLVSHPNGVRFLSDYFDIKKKPSLVGKINAEGLNAALKEFFWTEEGINFLEANRDLLLKISATALNHLYDQQDSPLHELVFTDAGVRLLSSSPHLISIIDTKALLAKKEDGTGSVHETLCQTAEGRRVIYRKLVANERLPNLQWEEKIAANHRRTDPPLCLARDILLEELCFSDVNWGPLAVEIYSLIDAEREALVGLAPNPEKEAILALVISATVAHLKNLKNNPVFTGHFYDVLSSLLSTADPRNTKAFVDALNKTPFGEKILCNLLLNRHDYSLIQASYRDPKISVVQPHQLLTAAKCFSDPDWGVLAVKLYQIILAERQILQKNPDMYKWHALDHMLNKAVGFANQNVSDNAFGTALFSCLQSTAGGEELLTALKANPTTKAILCRELLKRYSYWLSSEAIDLTFENLLLQRHCFTDPTWGQAAADLYRQAVAESQQLKLEPDAEKSLRFGQIMRAAQVFLSNPNQVHADIFKETVGRCCDNSSFSMKFIGALMVLAGLVTAALGVAGTYASMGLSAKLGCGAGAALMGCGATLFYKGMSDAVPDALQNMQHLPLPVM